MHRSSSEDTILERLERAKFRVIRGSSTPKMLNIETWELRDMGLDDPGLSTTPIEVEIVQGRVRIINGYMRIHALRSRGANEVPVALVE